MKRFVPLIAVFISLALTSCATPYQAKGFRGGYEDFSTSKDTFQITFTGNAHLSESKLRQYLFRRAAEVTLANGFSYFAILDSSDVSKNAMYLSEGSGFSVKKPGRSIRIKCFRENPGANLDVISAGEYMELNFPDRR